MGRQIKLPLFIFFLACLLGHQFNLFIFLWNYYDTLSYLPEKNTVASTDDNLQTFHHSPCSNDYNEERHRYHGCIPISCGFGIHDQLVTSEEATVLLNVAKRGLAYGGSFEGVSILDLHSGALSKGDDFVSIFNTVEKKDLLKAEDIRVYNTVKKRILQHIVATFGLALTPFSAQPTFFSRMNSSEARTVNGEYWHSHVDKYTYETFHYTSLLYLSTYGQDFQRGGGRFIFESPFNISKKEDWKYIEPKFGRVSFFTSGSEHPHHVEKVISGVRYALTIPFTCFPDKAIPDI